MFSGINFWNVTDLTLSGINYRFQWFSGFALLAEQIAGFSLKGINSSEKVSKVIGPTPSRIHSVIIPEGPKIKKIRAFEQDWKFQARMTFSSEPPTVALFLWGNRDVEIEIFERAWKFRSRLNISSEIEHFERDWFFLIVGPSGISAQTVILYRFWPEEKLFRWFCRSWFYHSEERPKSLNFWDTLWEQFGLSDQRLWKCSHWRVSLNPLKPVQILQHTTKNSAEQTAMRTKWFKQIAI